MEFKSTIRGAAAVQSTLRQIGLRMTDARPAMNSVALVLMRETERIFAREGRGVGLDHEWAALSEVTKQRREARAGGGPIKILQDTAKLAGSIQAVATQTQAGLSTNRVYAATMFFGAKRGEFGKNRRARPIPWGNIPARPFFPVRDVGGEFRLTDRAERSVLETMRLYLDPI